MLEGAHAAKLVERSPAAMTVTTRKGEILEANRAAAEILGYEDPGELVGTLITDRYVSLEDRERLLRELETEGEVRNLELDFHRQDGYEITIMANVVLVDDPEFEEGVILATWVDMTEHVALERELERQAFRDALTGLDNRRALYHRAGNILAMCRRQERAAALIYVDLVGFKQVNKEMGHSAGDEVLKEVGQRLDSTSRDSDVVSRVGGDEFVVLATLIQDQDDAVQAARRVLYCFDDPVTVQGRDLHLRPAVGVAMFPQDGTDIDTLLDRADRALWGPERQKAPGLRVYRPELDTEVPKALRLHEDLKAALQKGADFELHFQPIVPIRSGSVTGVEALIRWHHPELGLLPAGEFIPVAEASGLIGEIDRWVMLEAARQAAEWQKREAGPDWIAINLSAQTLGDPELPDFLEARLANGRGLEPTRLVIEITEHAALRQEQVVSEILRSLRETLGLSISIDDFGTGYSSLLYLRRFPADYLKVDMNFVQGLGESDADEKVVRSIIALGQAFDMELIGEGVETKTQLDWLTQEACDFLQGYLFGRPVPADELDLDGLGGPG